MRRRGSEWVSIWDTTNVTSQLTQAAYRGGGILRAVVPTDANGSGSGTGAAIVNVFDAVLDQQIVSPAFGVVPRIGRPLIIAGGAQIGGFVGVTGLEIEFYDGLVVSFQTDNASFVLLVFDPW